MAKLKDGFYKLTAEAVGSNSYMLLAGGGSKALSDFATASGVVTALGTNGNYVTWTKNGTANNLTVPYSTNADKLDGIHANGLLTSISSTANTNLSITVGGTTKSVNSLYANTAKHLEHTGGNTGSNKSLGLWFLVGELVIVDKALTNNNALFYVTDYYQRRTFGILRIEIRWDVDANKPSRVLPQWLVNNGFTLDNLQVSYGTENRVINSVTKSVIVLKIYIKAHDSTWSAVKLVKISDGGWDTESTNTWTLVSNRLTALPDNETYIVSENAPIYNLLSNTITFSAGTFSAETYNNSAAVTVNIPTKTSHLTNDSGYLTQHQSLSNYVTLNGTLTITGLKTFSHNLLFSSIGGSSATDTSVTYPAESRYIGWSGATDWARIFFRITAYNEGHQVFKLGDDSDAYSTWIFEYPSRVAATISTTGINPGVTTDLTLGTKDLKWKNVYSTTFTGNLDGTAKALANYYSSRPNSIAPGVTGDGSMFHFLCTSAVTDNKTDPGDAHILHFNWDNKGGYDFQIAGLTGESTMKIRGMNLGTWQSWATVLSSANYTSYVNTTNFPGLNSVGDITGVTAGAGLGGGGTSGSVTLTNAGVRSATINGNYLRVNTNGTNADLTIPYATTASLLNNTSVSDPSTAASGQNVKWYSQINNSSGYAGTNYGFPVSNNANGILWLGTHSGPFGWLMGFSSNGHIYARYISNNSFSTTANGGSWNRIAWISDIPAVTDYYWANVKISSSSSTSTTPTFKTATATTSVTTPLVNSTGRLTLNATNTGLDLKFGADNTKSVILNGTAFKPFDAATEKLSLGTSSARWSALYSGTGNFTGDITLLSSSGDSPKLYFVRGGAIGDSGALWDWRMYSSSGHFYLLSDLGAGTWSTLLFINTSNNVGIGTISPSQKLHVNGLVNITANSGTLTIGCLNTSYTHYSTTGGTHWFNKAVEINGSLTPHANASFNLGSSSKRWSNIYGANGNFSTKLNIDSGADAKIILNNTDTETKYQYISFRQEGTEYGSLGTFGDNTLKWSGNTILHSGNSSVSKSGQTLTVKINGVELSLTNTTYSSLKNPNAIKFKNTSGTTITYDGSSAADLTAGVNYATSAGTATTISGFTKRATANCTWGTLTASNEYTPVYWGDTASSGGFGFSDKGGKTYMQIDGDYYAQEGTKLVLHTGNSSVSGGGSSWGSSITVNIGGTSKTLTIPSNPNTDTKVTQTITSSDATYPLLLAPSGQTATTTTTAYFDSGVTLNPSTNTIAANISGSSDYLKILDVRNTDHLPNSTTYPEKNITAWFNLTGTPTSSWWSGITVKGYSNTYSVWLLCSYSGVGTDNDYRLYHRNGINNTWGSWKTVAYTSDIPSVGNGTVTIKQGGTEKGSFTMNQSGNTTIELTDNNSDTKVRQTNTTGNSTYRVLLSGSNNDTTETTTARKSTKLLFNTYTGKMDLSGSISIATSIADHSSPTAQCLVINSTAVPSGTMLSLKNSPGIGFHISNTSWASLVWGPGGFNFINSDANGYQLVNTSMIKCISNDKYISITPANSSYIHYTTDATIGHYFNTTVHVNGAVAPYGNNSFTSGTVSYRWSNVYAVNGNFSGRITSSIATGTSPFKIDSTTVNTNLNADMLDGYHIWTGTRTQYNSATKNNNTIYLIYS